MSERLNKAIERYVSACKAVNELESIETAAEMVAAWLALKSVGHAAYGRAADTVVFALIRSRFGVEGMNALSAAFRRPAVHALMVIANKPPNPTGGSGFSEGGGKREPRSGFPISAR